MQIICNSPSVEVDDSLFTIKGQLLRRIVACSLPASGRHTSCCKHVAFCFFSSACNQMRVVARDAGSGNARSMMLVSSLASLPSKVSCFRRSSASCTGDRRRTMRQPTTAFLWGSDRRSKRPKSKNVLDTTMAWGDILTLMATELVSSTPQHNAKTRVTCAASCLVAIDTFRQFQWSDATYCEYTIDLTAMRTGERKDSSVCLWAALHRHYLGVGGRGGGEG